MKIILQAIRSMFNKLERVIEEHSDSLENLRYQSQIVLELESGQCSCDFETVAAMDPDEIHNCLYLLGEADSEGAVHSFSALHVEKEEKDGEICISFYVLASDVGKKSGIPNPIDSDLAVYRYRWTAEGLTRDHYSYSLTQCHRSDTYPAPDGKSAHCCVSVCMAYNRGGTQTPEFRRLDRLPLDGFVLVSRSGNGTKFFLSIDDSGTLVATPLGTDW